jgi:hypothetical protein
MGVGHGQLQLTGHNLGRVFNFRFDHLQAEHFRCYQIKLPNLKFKTWPKQLQGSLSLVITLPRVGLENWKLELISLGEV